MTTEFIKPEEIETKLIEGKKTVVAVAANWCGPCKMMTEMVWSPINEEKGDIQIFKINVDDYKDWAKSEGVSELPTMIVFDGKNKKDERLIGFIAKEEFVAKIKMV